MTKDIYRIVVIDDERIPAPGADSIVVETHRTLAEGLAILQAYHDSGEHIDELWLDHDLGLNDDSEFGWDTIMPVVNWLEEMGHFETPLSVGMIFVHTANPAAAPRMMDALRPYYTVIRENLPEERDFQ